MTEFELKLMVPAGQHAAVLAELELAGVSPVALAAHYMDTPDGRLSAAGLTLRVRREGASWVQTLKGQGDSPVRRLEDNVCLDEPAGGALPHADLRLHRGRRTRQALQAALGTDTPLENIKLVELFRTTVSRRARPVSVDGTTFEVAFDEGQIEASGRSRALSEVEIEFKSGDSMVPLFALAAHLVATRGLWLSTIAKSDRGHSLLRPQAPQPVARFGAPSFDPSNNGNAQFQAIVGHCLSQIIPSASHVAGENRDAEQLHQLRVGLRRLRTALHELPGWSPAIDPLWERSLADAFRALGAYRDHDAVMLAVRPRLLAAGAPLAGVLPEPSADGRTAAELVRDPEFQKVLLALLAFSLERGEGPFITARAARRLLVKRLNKLHDRVVADGKRFLDLPPEDQHQVRKRLKRLRYLCEFAIPVFGKGKVGRYLKHLRPAQDALGTHHDDVVALEGFRAQAHPDAGAWFAIGWLSAEQVRTAAVCHKALAKIRPSDRFWI